MVGDEVIISAAASGDISETSSEGTVEETEKGKKASGRSAQRVDKKIKKCKKNTVPMKVSDKLKIAYETFVSTVERPSIMPGAGTGLVSNERLDAFTWVGFYPGQVTKKINGKRVSHTMGTVTPHFILFYFILFYLL